MILRSQSSASYSEEPDQTYEQFNQVQEKYKQFEAPGVIHSSSQDDYSSNSDQQ